MSRHKLDQIENKINEAEINLICLIDQYREASSLDRQTISVNIQNKENIRKTLEDERTKIYTKLS